MEIILVGMVSFVLGVGATILCLISIGKDEAKDAPRMTRELAEAYRQSK